MSRARGAFAIIAAALIAGCWTLTTDVELSPAGATPGTERDGRAPTPGGDDDDDDDGGSPRDANAPDTSVLVERPFCAAAGNAKLKRCFDYDEVDAGSLNLTGFGPVTREIVSTESRSPPSSLAFAYPSLGSQSAGAQHEIDVPFAPKRIRLEFDLRIDFGSGTRPEYVQVAGFLRGDVYAMLLYNVAGNFLQILEQDQRPNPLINAPLKGRADVDVTSWQRIELVVDFEKSKVSCRVVGGPSSGELPIAMLHNVPGRAYFGNRYLDDTTATLAMRYDNVVVLAD